MQCKICGGSMSQNSQKVPGSKMPDWICDQVNGECLNERGYPNAQWNPKPTSITQKPIIQTPVPGVAVEVWETKNRLYAAQTALNCVAQIYEGQGGQVTDLQIKAKFNYFYNLLRNAKNGIVPRIDVAPKDMPLKKKIVSNPAFNPADEVSEIPLEEIPF